jgi:hypothetical protein
MPLTKYKLHRKSFQDSINLNLSSSIPIESQPTVSENNHKRQRIESVEENTPLQSTITITTPTEPVEKEPKAKKLKTKTIEDQVVQPPPTPVIQPASEPPIVQSAIPTWQETIVEEEIISEAPLTLPSTNGRIRELKSKTPAWKAQKPTAKGNTQGNISLFSYSFNINLFRQNAYPVRFG